MRREVGIPKTIRIFLIAIGVLGFAVGSLAPNAAGGVLALLSALLVVFLFLFTTSGSAKRAGEGEGSGAEKRIGGSETDRVDTLTGQNHLSMDGRHRFRPFGVVFPLEEGAFFRPGSGRGLQVFKP